MADMTLCCSAPQCLVTEVREGRDLPIDPYVCNPPAKFQDAQGERNRSSETRFQDSSSGAGDGPVDGPDLPREGVHVDHKVLVAVAISLGKPNAKTVRGDMRNKLPNKAA